MLEVRDLKKSFAGFVAVSEVGFSLEPRSVMAIIGPNGAGKSTLFNLITGHIRPTSGQVLHKGADITAAAPHVITRRGIGRSFQHTNIFPKLTVFECIQAAFIAHHRRGSDFWGRATVLFRPETEALLERLGLAGKADELAGALSHGNQKQIELGIALASDPDILLLDEPTAGMSAAETRETIALLESIALERGLSLLFTEHDMEVVFQIAQRIGVLHQGRMIALGTPTDIRADAEVRRVYLGGHG